MRREATNRLHLNGKRAYRNPKLLKKCLGTRKTDIKLNQDMASTPGPSCSKHDLAKTEFVRTLIRVKLLINKDIYS